jgi:hypothetical protein
MIRADIYSAFWLYLHQKKIVDRLRFSALEYMLPTEQELFVKEKVFLYNNTFN